MRNLVATFVERRTGKRINLNMRTRLRYSGQQPADIVVRELSFTGFKGDTNAPLKQGDLISVGLPNIGLVRATVKSSNDGQVAAAFYRSVDVRSCFRTPAVAVAAVEPQPESANDL